MRTETPVLVVGLPSASEGRVGTVAAADVDDARLYLAGTEFAAVFVPDEASASALRPHSGPAPVHVVEDGAALAARLAALAGDAPAGEPGLDRDEMVLALRSLQERIAGVVHSINNPLAVIAGNAQLALEVLRATGGDDLLMDAVVDIEAGARDLGERFAEILALRASLDELVGRM